MKPSGVLMIIALLAAPVLDGCVISTEEICRSRLPEMQDSLENALTVLKDWHEHRAARRLASLEGVRPDPTAPNLSEPDRKSWQKWAEVRLIATQRYIDQIPGDPRFRGARAALTEMANEFVAF